MSTENPETDVYIEQQETMHCDHCQKPLMKILSVNFKSAKSRNKSKYRIVKCAYCGKSSIPSKTFRGSANIKPEPGIELRDTDCQEMNGTVITDIETYKK